MLQIYHHASTRNVPDLRRFRLSALASSCSADLLDNSAETNDYPNGSNSLVG